ncbi:MAG TPA: acyl-CoA synthetase [Candidatus Cybelea sp.]|nr:acyl-CoA synthetase [Candidatus Cybelea sp.]
MPIATLTDIEALERVPFSERQPARSVYEMLAAVAGREPDKLAFRSLVKGLPDEPTKDVTYGTLKRRITQAANLFRGLGVGPSDSVSLLMPISAETFYAIFGAQAAGMANPINFLLETDHIVGLLREARCRVLLGPDPDLLPGVWQKIEAVRHAVPGLKAVIRVGGPAERPDIDALHFESALERQNGDRLDFVRETKPDDVIGLFHTGGTTSAPKLARHTQRGLLMQAWSNSEVLRPEPDQVYFNGLPPFHVGGATCAGLAPLSRGATIVLLTAAGLRNPLVVQNLWKLVDRFRPTVLGMVPTSWGAALNIPSDGCDLTSIKLCNVGGSTMPVEIAKAVQDKLHAPVIEGWGMTEVHGFASMNPAAGESRIGSVGLRTPYTELAVAKVGDGRVTALCKVGEIGKVLVRGHQVFGGYVNPAHDREAWIEPMRGENVPAWSPGGRWLDTGDLGRFDAEGYLWLTGRAKDLIIRGGHNIDPLAIEEVLHQHPAVESAAAVGRPDAYAGEIPVAFVQLKAGAKADPAEIQAFARERIAERAAAPAEITILELMPLTGVGKIFKPQLRYLAAQRTFERIISPLLDRGLSAKVEVGPHPEHGTFVAVQLGKSASPAVVAKVRGALKGVPLRHEVTVSAT